MQGGEQARRQSTRAVRTAGALSAVVLAVVTAGGCDRPAPPAAALPPASVEEAAVAAAAAEPGAAALAPGAETPGEPVGTTASPPASPLPAGTGIPPAVLAAYRAAAGTLAASEPSCRLSWTLLAGIGQMESGHASAGRVDGLGTTVDPIIGARLDGAAGLAAVRDTDGGGLDGDVVWDRAVGPMQIIPGTWRLYAADGNGDGVASPHNVFDAALTAGTYLCAGGGDLARPAVQRAALLRYNASVEYGTAVLGWADAYGAGRATFPSLPGPSTSPQAPATPAPAPAAPAPAPAAPAAPAPVVTGPSDAPVAPAPIPTGPTVPAPVLPGGVAPAPILTAPAAAAPVPAPAVPSPAVPAPGVPSPAVPAPSVPAPVVTTALSAAVPTAAAGAGAAAEAGGATAALARTTGTAPPASTPSPISTAVPRASADTSETTAAPVVTATAGP